MSSPEPQVKDPNLVTLSIDGQEVTVPRGTLVVEAAKRLAVEVPVFCYHHKLDPVGACRLCLVEVSPGPPKPTTACTTPVAEGMVVRTNSAIAVAARADILEYELANHPLDCPVCDKGGECPLQDFTFRHGYPTSHVAEPKVHFRKPIPLSGRIALDRERCVLCYRCTRYYDEIAWEQELTSEQRGVHTYIASQGDRPLTSLFSGNIIDLCPVGALTSRVWRFESRPWDMEGQASVCSRCSVGCNVTLWQRRNELVRVTSRENDAIDDGWICDRGRFEYTHVNRPDRPRTPLVKGVRSTWAEAMDRLVEGLSERKVGILLPADVTNEELYLIRRLVEGPLLGAKVVLRGRSGLSLPTVPTMPIADLDRAKTIAIIASDTRDDVPVLNLRVKKAVAKRGANLVVVAAGDLDLDRWPKALHVRPEPGQLAAAVERLAELPELQSGGVALLYGDGRGSEDVARLEASVERLRQRTGASVMPLFRGPNERGALALGIQLTDSLEGCDSLLLWGDQDWEGLPQGVSFRAVWSSRASEENVAADVFLPAATFAETQGSLTSLEGRVQDLHPVLRLPQPQRENWEVLSELLQRLGETAGYPGIYAVRRELAASAPAFPQLSAPPAEARASWVMQGPSRP